MKFNREDLILILAPERCGTVSLLESLEGYNRGIIHFMGRYQPGYGGFITQDHEFVLDRPRIDEIFRENKIGLVITTVRDPVARIVSDVFHKASQGEVPFRGDVPPVEYVMALGCPDNAMFHMEYEVERFVGIQVLDRPFRPRVSVYLDGRVPLMIVRIKDFDILPAALKEVGVDIKEVKHINKCAYPQDIKFPTLYVDRILGMPYTKTFFTEDEIEEMRQKWCEQL